MNKFLVASIALLALPVLDTHTAAAEPASKCRWEGTALDPFTGKDGRKLPLSYAMFYSLGFLPSPSGKLSVEVYVANAGVAQKEPMVQPVQILLADNSVIDLTLPSPVGGTIEAGNSVATVYTYVASLSAENSSKLASASGATLIRVHFPGRDVDVPIKGARVKEIPGAATCAITP